MTDRLTRRRLVRTVAAAAGVTVRDAAPLVNGTLDALAAHLAAGGTASLRGLGHFTVRIRPARLLRVPGRGEVEVPSRPLFRFRPSPALRNARPL